MNEIASKKSSSPYQNYFTEKQFSWNITGVMEADNGDFEGALKSFSKAIEMDPKNGVSYFNRASVKMRLGDIEGARTDFRLSEKLVSNNNI